MKDGYVSMSLKSARNEMAETYETARTWVVVTNVGTLDFFLCEDTAYQELNLSTFERGVPVIRFFLYGPAPRQADSNFSFDQFKQQAMESMKRMKTACGVFINAGDVSTGVAGLDGPQDFLLIDNWFAAHAEMDSATWEIQRVRATTRKENIQQYCQYLDVLQIMQAKQVIGLDEIDDDDFNGKAILAKKMGNRTGKQIFKEVMDRMTHTP